MHFRNFISNNFVKIFLIAFVMIAVFIPALFRGLGSEEGIFTFISYRPWKSPYQGIIGREDMLLKRIILKHPIAVYAGFRGIGKIIQNLTHLLGITDNPIRNVFFLRVAILGLTTIHTSLLLWFCFSTVIHHKNSMLYLITCMTLISSVFFGIAASLIHYESLGFSMISFALLLLLVATYATKKKLVQQLLLLCSGILLGLGKNEWSIIAFFAWGITYCICQKSEAKWHVWHCVFGMVIGNVVSFLLGPVHYLGGFEIIAQSSFGQKDFYYWQAKSAYLVFFIGWFWKEIIVLSALAWFMVKAHRNDTSYKDDWLFLFSIIFVVLIVGAFLIASWFADGFPRYYLICIPFVLIIIAIFLKKEVSFAVQRQLVLAFVVILLMNIGEQFFGKIGFKNALPQSRSLLCSEQLAREGIDDAYVYVVPTGVGWYLPGLNFIHDDLNKKNMIHRKPLSRFRCLCESDSVGKTF